MANRKKIGEVDGKTERTLQVEVTMRGTVHVTAPKETFDEYVADLLQTISFYGGTSVGVGGSARWDKFEHASTSIISEITKK